MRLRLTLDRTGHFAATATPFRPLAADAVWTAVIATPRLRSDDPRLRHKTSARATYETGRAEAAARGADEAVFLNERGEVCEGGITSVFIERDGRLLTPPLSSGLLPGVLRARLIEEGRAGEAVLRPADLGAAPRFFLGNSLRGLIPARLLG